MRSEETAGTMAADTGNVLRTQAHPDVALLVVLFRLFADVTGEGKSTTLNTMVLKAAEDAPLSVLLLPNCAEYAGDILNMITGLEGMLTGLT